MYEYLIKFCLHLNKTLFIIIYILVTIIHFLLVYIEQHETNENREETIKMYFILIALGYLLLSGPYNKALSEDVFQVTDGSVRMKSYILKVHQFNKFFCNLITLFLIGYILETSMFILI